MQDVPMTSSVPVVVSPTNASPVKNPSVSASLPNPNLNRSASWSNGVNNTSNTSNITNPETTDPSDFPSLPPASTTQSQGSNESNSHNSMSSLTLEQQQHLENLRRADMLAPLQRLSTHTRTNISDLSIRSQQVAASAFNGLGSSTVFPVPVSSLSISIWSVILTSSTKTLESNPYEKLNVSISDLLDLTLPPVDAVGMSPWPKPLAYYRQGYDVANNNNVVYDNASLLQQQQQQQVAAAMQLQRQRELLLRQYQQNGNANSIPGIHMNVNTTLQNNIPNTNTSSTSHNPNFNMLANTNMFPALNTKLGYNNMNSM